MERIKSLIEEYGIKISGTGLSLDSRPSDADLEFIKNEKLAIVDYIKNEKLAKEKTAKEREDKIKAIEELRTAIAEWEEYHYQNEKRFDNAMTSSFGIAKPKSNVTELRAKYPRATAYLIADGWIFARNYAKSAAGKKALEKIINGENHEIVISEMKKEWELHCESKIWD